MIQKKWKLKNNVKIKIKAHAFKGFANSYNIEILYSFNSELQLKDVKTTIENKLKKLLAELRGFKFVTTLVLVFRKIKSDNKTKYDTLYSNSKAEIIINESDMMMYFSQSILRLY